MSPHRSYHAKLLLFGEYTVLTGSGSLAIPLRHYSLSLTHTEKGGFDGHVRMLYDFLCTLDLSAYHTFFQPDEYRHAFESGLQIQADIPIGYGVGSSGAVTAAIFDRFYKYGGRANFEELRLILGSMESYFHGKSSGTDPLISYLDHGLFISSSGKIVKFDRVLSGSDSPGIFLVDSGIARRTEKYVKIFRDHINNKTGFKKSTKDLSEINDQVMHALIQGKCISEFWDLLKLISQIQWKIFPDMIPEHIKPIWNHCLGSDSHVMKLCGAGGGGFFLLFSHDRDELQERFPEIPIVRAL